MWCSWFNRSQKSVKRHNTSICESNDSLSFHRYALNRLCPLVLHSVPWPMDVISFQSKLDIFILELIKIAIKKGFQKYDNRNKQKMLYLLSDDKWCKQSLKSTVCNVNGVNVTPNWQTVFLTAPTLKLDSVSTNGPIWSQLAQEHFSNPVNLQNI